MTELAPSGELLARYKKIIQGHKTDCPCAQCESAWNHYETTFRNEMKNPKAQEAIKMLREIGNLTLLCYCRVSENVKHCHRIIVQEMIEIA